MIMSRRRDREQKIRYVHTVTVRRANGRYVTSRDFPSRYAARVQLRAWVATYDETYSVTHDSRPM